MGWKIPEDALLRPKILYQSSLLIDGSRAQSSSRTAASDRYNNSAVFFTHQSPYTDIPLIAQ